MAVLHGATVLAQGYPNRALRIIVPLAPGGNVDLIAREANIKAD